MAHIHDLYDFTVSAFIVHDNKVLLLHHKNLNTWLQPGGHIELNEDPEEALWREIEEETSLTKEVLKIVSYEQNRPKAPRAKSLPLPFDLNVHTYGESNHKHIDFCYHVTSSTADINQNVEESNDLRWFSVEDIEAIKEDLLPDIYERSLFVLNTTI